MQVWIWLPTTTMDTFFALYFCYLCAIAPLLSPRKCQPQSSSTLILTTLLVEMPSAAPRGDDLDANYVNEEYYVQPVGTQNNADTTFRVATSMLSRALSPLRTMARM